MRRKGLGFVLSRQNGPILSSVSPCALASSWAGTFMPWAPCSSHTLGLGHRASPSPKLWARAQVSAGKPGSASARAHACFLEGAKISGSGSPLSQHQPGTWGFPPSELGRLRESTWWASWRRGLGNRQNHRQREGAGLGDLGRGCSVRGQEGGRGNRVVSKVLPPGAREEAGVGGVGGAGLWGVWGVQGVLGV